MLRVYGRGCIFTCSSRILFSRNILYKLQVNSLSLWAITKWFRRSETCLVILLTPQFSLPMIKKSHDQRFSRHMHFYVKSYKHFNELKKNPNKRLEWWCLYTYILERLGSIAKWHILYRNHVAINQASVKVTMVRMTKVR